MVFTRAAFENRMALRSAGVSERPVTLKIMHCVCLFNSIACSETKHLHQHECLFLKNAQLVSPAIPLDVMQAAIQMANLAMGGATRASSTVYLVMNALSKSRPACTIPAGSLFFQIAFVGVSSLGKGKSKTDSLQQTGTVPIQLLIPTRRLE